MSLKLRKRTIGGAVRDKSYALLIAPGQDVDCVVIVFAVTLLGDQKSFWLSLLKGLA